jgi:PAS domain S-box-containing protein
MAGKTVVRTSAGARRGASNTETPPRGGAAVATLPPDPGIDLGVQASDILDALPFYALLLDDQHHILLANSAVREQTGLTAEALVGQYCPAAIHGLSEPWYACPLEEAVEKGRAVEREALDKESGRWMRSSVYPTSSFTPDGRRIYLHLVSNITDTKTGEAELRASREQLRELSQFLESVREEERTKMAREIHDELGQILTALKIELSWLTRRLPQERESLLEKSEAMSELIDGAIMTVKRISSELRPGVLDDLGLADAIEWQTQEFGKLTDISVRFSARPENIVLDRDRSTAIFRVCQEALTNIARHANATRVSVSLRQGAERLSLKISDNGRGIEESQITDPRAFGLVGMRERARYWGGEVKVTRGPEKGTVVTVSIPVGKRERLYD